MSIGNHFDKISCTYTLNILCYTQRRIEMIEACTSRTYSLFLVLKYYVSHELESRCIGSHYILMYIMLYVYVILFSYWYSASAMSDLVFHTNRDKIYIYTRAYAR